MSLLPLKPLRVQRLEFKSTVTGLPVTNKRGGAICVVSPFLLLKAVRVWWGRGEQGNVKVLDNSEISLDITTLS